MRPARTALPLDLPLVVPRADLLARQPDRPVPRLGALQRPGVERQVLLRQLLAGAPALSESETHLRASCRHASSPRTSSVALLPATGGYLSRGRGGRPDV